MHGYEAYLMRIYARVFFEAAEGGPGSTSARETLATAAVSGPHAAVSPLQHSAWFKPNIGQRFWRHAA